MVVIIESFSSTDNLIAQEAKIKRLTAKDTIIILSSEEGTVPISTIELLLQSKAKIRFIPAPSIENVFELGVIYGTIIATYPGENIVALGDRKIPNIGISDSVKTKRKSVTSVNDETRIKNKNKNLEEKETKPPVVQSSVSPIKEKKRRTPQKKFSHITSEEMLNRFSSLAPLEAEIKAVDDELLRVAFEKATDNENSLLVQLQMTYGITTGEAVWSAIKDSFCK